MSKNVIVFGSTMGNTEQVAHQLAELLPDGADIFAVNSFRMENLRNYDQIFLGTSTWGSGELQDDWASELPKLGKLDLQGKKVALFGLGDSSGYGDTFVDGLGDLHEAVAQTGAERMGFWPTDGYRFEASRGIVEGQFVGLVLDVDNEANLTESRLSAWVGSL